MSPQLSCNVQHFIATTSLQPGWEQNEISIKLELWRKNHTWNGPRSRWVCTFYFHSDMFLPQISEVLQNACTKNVHLFNLNYTHASNVILPEKWICQIKLICFQILEYLKIQPEPHTLYSAVRLQQKSNSRIIETDRILPTEMWDFKIWAVCYWVSLYKQFKTKWESCVSKGQSTIQNVNNI